MRDAVKLKKGAYRTLLAGRTPEAADVQSQRQKPGRSLRPWRMTSERLSKRTTIRRLSLPGTVYSGVLERRVRRIVEPRIQEEQCGFRPGRGTVDQLYTLDRVLEGAWEFTQPVYTFCGFGKGVRPCPSGAHAGGASGVQGTGFPDRGCPVPV